ncbi:MAG: ubiB [Gammaproteobacteria bacterium]|jgi:ubiquinone biosynthesis protein|nr:ubiB [Gammaproteobacteria bacterium]
MKYFTRLSRFIYIYFILIRYNLDAIFFKITWLHPLHFLNYLNPWRWFLKNKLSRGERIRLALEMLGPIFIKAGQILSTRRDLLPEDIAEELEKLQDQVPPFPGEQARKMIEKALNSKITEIFRDFDIKALASASIAQVHAATLLDGRAVVIKVLRPHIKKIIEKDLDLLKILAHFADRFWKKGRRFKPKEIVSEIAHTLYDELDLMREGANASQLRRNFQYSSQLYIPEIYWTYCRPNILVMERVAGISAHNIPALRSTGINMKKLAETGIELFFTQVFRDSFFHADMHPGNIFVNAKHLENPQYIAVDFGIVGSLNSKDQRYLAENMLAFFQRDYQRVAELHVTSGWLPPDTRIDQFEGAIRAVCEPIFERPLKEISFGQLLLRLFQTARRFNINIQPQLILLQKTLLNIEGIGRQIYPDLDLWATAAPFLEKWLKNQVGMKAFMRKIKNNLPYWSEKLPEIPLLFFDVLQQTKARQEEEHFLKKTLPTYTKHAELVYFLLGLSSGLLGGLIFYFFLGR